MGQIDAVADLALSPHRFECQNTEESIPRAQHVEEHAHQQHLSDAVRRGKRGEEAHEARRADCETRPSAPDAIAFVQERSRKHAAEKQTREQRGSCSLPDKEAKTSDETDKRKRQMPAPFRK